MAAPQEEAGQASPSAWYGLGVLFIAYTFSFIDRSILSLLVQPIKASLDLTDTQVSLLHGLAFAIFYTFLGIPIAWLADRKSRKNIITIGIVIWSIMTAACGLAGRFATLFLARVGVGVGEAALSPAAYSMLTDMFPKRQLGLAMGLYSTGVYVGAGLAFIIGGVAVQTMMQAGSFDLPIIGMTEPWQMVFIIVGLPGLLVALLMLTVKEPARRTKPAVDGDNSLLAVFRFIRTEPATFLLHFTGFALLGLLFNAFIAWTPTLFIREYGMETGEIGSIIGGLILVFGSAGIVVGGVYGDRIVKSGNLAGPMLSARLAGLVLIPASMLAPTAGSVSLSIALFAVFFFFSAFPYGSAAAAIQMAAPSHLRAQASAVYLFVLNLVGIGFGPTAIALLTDYFFADEAQLGWSMMLVGGASAALGTLALHLGSKPFSISVQKRNEELAHA